MTALQLRHTDTYSHIQAHKHIRAQARAQARAKRRGWGGWRILRERQPVPGLATQPERYGSCRVWLSLYQPTGAVWLYRRHLRGTVLKARMFPALALALLQ